ncbi:hypothetical protein [Chitinophaga sancti]|uniref:Uncharacterized protein n=1 Tax=Chitinophaga sancti TaxID=1004 RepID=A0A1K1LQW6_9BACT|nr:hypothetical protein [Chitinophaga sancti]WQD64914.1 hypothetical protein U0033_10960 [Chitinophaga sancti]WQG89462.1 hypothetical protein SR876_31510 [Chitinophaga sancti]SFW13309.1 hypothetical protein SAMN05661012_00148 [Chitinophaga sancti]
MPQFTIQGVEPAIEAAPSTNTSNGSSTLIEEETYLDRQLERQIRMETLVSLKEGNKTRAQNNVERKKYAGWIFVLTCIWAFLIFVLIFCVGLSFMTISDSIIVTLISSTTINFFGFFFLVVKYLFNTGNGGASNGTPQEMSSGTITG